MPNKQNNTKAINARRIAALLAGFDLGNASEEEALAKARVLRRMAAGANMRPVDLMEQPEVKQAIDDQLHPARTESPELKEALEQAAALREELTQRTREARKLTELLRQREEAAQDRRAQPPAARPVPEKARAPVAADSFWDDPVVGAISYAVGWLIGVFIAWRLTAF